MSKYLLDVYDENVKVNFKSEVTKRKSNMTEVFNAFMKSFSANSEVYIGLLGLSQGETGG